MWLIVCCFSVSDEHGQTSNVIWFSTTWLLVFWLEVANKKPSFTKPAGTWIEIYCYKNLILHSHRILYPNSARYAWKMLFANASKITRNWFLTLQPDIFLIICNLPKWAQEREWIWYEHLMLYNVFAYAQIYALIYLRTYVKERKASSKFLH